MHVTLSGFVLFLHISVAILAFMMAGVMHAAMPAMARASTIGEMRSWARVVHRLEPLFPLSALVLLGLGAWLVHLGEHTDDNFSFSTGWVLDDNRAVVVVEAIGPELPHLEQHPPGLVVAAGGHPVEHPRVPVPDDALDVERGEALRRHPCASLRQHLRGNLHGIWRFLRHWPS